MKNSSIVILAFLVTHFSVTAQTMKWIPMDPGTSMDNCKSASSGKTGLHCYSLQYIPAVSGTLTSYTTGFFVSCTSKGSAIAKNESCSMTNNVTLIDGCTVSGQVLINSSGNTGISGVNSIQAGRPVYLHQVCFSIPVGEEITVMKDDLTDLTTSIDLGNGQVVTERPLYITQNIGRPKYDVSMPVSLVDFVTRIAGNHLSQLDWTISGHASPSSFVIEHALDGVTFNAVGEVRFVADPDRIQAYQYLDSTAVEGFNFYRLKIFDGQGHYEYSPIRVIHFSDGQFGVKAWPSPVKDILNVAISHAGQSGTMTLLDADGKEVYTREFADGDSDLQVRVGAFTPGVYTIVVHTGSNHDVEKILVMR